MSLLNRPKFILFGDSLTQRSLTVRDAGWAALLASLYSNKIDILVRGFSGYNTRWALRLTPNLFDAQHLNRDPPELVTLLWGANDATAPESPQHVPINEYRDNLAKMVQLIRTATSSSTKIIVISIPAFDAAKWAFWCKDTKKPADWIIARSEAIVKDYAAASKQVAEQEKVLFIDLYSQMLADPTWKKYLEDGLHFSLIGNKFLYYKLVEFINENIPSLQAEKLAFDFPYWAEIDPQNLDQSLAAFSKPIQ